MLCGAFVFDNDGITCGVATVSDTRLCLQTVFVFVSGWHSELVSNYLDILHMIAYQSTGISLNKPKSTAGLNDLSNLLYQYKRTVGNSLLSFTKEIRLHICEDVFRFSMTKHFIQYIYFFC